MTKDEILNMPAGREMDVLIADRFNLYSNNPVVGDRYERGKGYIKQYSIDIAAAWDVVEKLYELGWRLDLFDMRHDESYPGWWYELNRYEGARLGDIEHEFPTHYHTLDGGAETAPLAICRAALLAVMK